MPRYWPTADPDFVRHFTNSAYDPEVCADESVPFGTDEGSDTVSDVIDRVDILRKSPALKDALSLSAGTIDQATDIDEEIVAAGFGMLRYAGRIEDASLYTLVKALQRQSEQNSDYDVLLRDLSTFRETSSRVLGIVSEGKTARRQWLKVGKSNDPSFDRWLKVVADNMMADTVWRQWWQSAPPNIKQITLYIGINGGDEVRVNVSKGRVDVRGTSVQLTTRAYELLHSNGVAIRDNDMGLNEFADDFPQMILDLVSRMFQSAADHIGMTPPPPMINPV